MESKQQILALVESSAITAWWQHRHGGEQLKGSGIPERNDFVEAIRAWGYECFDKDKRDKWCCDVYVILLEIPITETAAQNTAEIRRRQTVLSTCFDGLISFQSLSTRIRVKSSKPTPVVL